jgi:hypothetical protein
LFVKRGCATIPSMRSWLMHHRASWWLWYAGGSAVGFWIIYPAYRDALRWVVLALWVGIGVDWALDRHRKGKTTA